MKACAMDCEWNAWIRPKFKLELFLQLASHYFANIRRQPVEVTLRDHVSLARYNAIFRSMRTAALEASSTLSGQVSKLPKAPNSGTSRLMRSDVRP